MNVKKLEVGRMRAQLSAEMLILIVVVLAVIALVASQLFSTVKKGSETVGNQTTVIFWKAQEEMKSKEGEACKDDSDCKSGLRCFENVCVS
jgi:uncharacterized protein (UPF0333 family)